MQENKKRVSDGAKRTASGGARNIQTGKSSKKSSKKGGSPYVLYILAGAVVAVIAAILLQSLFPTTTGSDKPIAEIQSSSSPVLITEVMSDNSSVIQDSYGKFSDWIELTNISGSTVNLNGWKIARDTNTTKYFEFPSFELKSGEQVLIFCTNVLENNKGYEFHAPFKLSSAGCMLILYNAEGIAMQSFNVPDLKANTSYAYIDGAFQVCLEPTPGKANTHENYLATRASRTVTSSPIMLTELMAKNVSYAPDENGEYPDWVEIYNSSSQTVSLYNYALSDNETNLRKWIFPNISIGPGQYMIIYCSGYDRTDPSSPLHTNFRLSTEKEGVIMTDAQGNIIDMVDYDLLKADQSLSRLSDGSWVNYKDPTPGYANTSSSAALISGQFAAQNSSGVFINEVMASTTTSNVNNASYDWVELRNNSSQTVDLSGYGLSDNPSKPRKWQFPEGTTIAPGAYLGIYLSGLGTENAKIGSYFHTNFCLSSTECETLVLSDPTGKILDRCPLGVQYSDISYGRMGTSVDSGFYYLTASTPGTVNVGTGYAERMATPTFSVEGGLFAAGDTITLTLSAEPDATIYYTLDSSSPDPSELDGYTYRVDPEFINSVSGQTRTYVYTGPITITGTTVVRAMAAKTDQLSSIVATQTYLVGVNHSMQVVSLVMDPEDLWSYTKGLYVKGPNAYAESPYGSLDRGANFWMTWEKEANVELFDLDGSAILSQGCGVRLHGQYSRKEAQKAFKVIARSRYGSNRFYGKLFPNRDYTEYQSFLLRQSGQDTEKTRMRDSILSALAADINALNQDPERLGFTVDTEPVMYQDTNLVVVYLNGEYWGHYNMRERINTFSICQWEGWDPALKDDIDLLKANDTVMKGSKATWTEFKAWYTKNGINTDEKLETASKYIDVYNYLSYCAVEIYTGNTDLLNCKKYRCAQVDGKWRWILYDFDWAFTTDTNSVNRWLTPGGVGDGNKCDNSLFIALMENNKCKDYFLTVFSELMANEWSSGSVVSRIQTRYYELEPELSAHLARWNLTQSTYESRLKSFVSYANNRPGRLLYFFSNKLSKADFEHYFGDIARSVQLINDKGVASSYY